MKLRLLNRMIGVVVIGAVSLVGMNRPASAQQEPQGKQDQQQPAVTKQDQQPPEQQPVVTKKPKAKQPNQKQPEPAVQKPKQQQPIAAPEPAVQKPKPRKPDAAPQPVAQKPKPKQRLPEERRQELIIQQKQRTTEYRQHLQDQERLARERALALRQENRLAQYRYQQQYYERLRQQRTTAERYERSYPYNRDPYFYTAPSYRYARGGTYYVTNRYGMDLLRQAANYGYQQGFEAGRADRSDHWGNGFEDSFPYQDANYGYRGYYVDQSEYNYYFREGFRRGYEDGYNSRYNYGRRSNGTYVILASVLAGFLIFEALNE